MERKKSVTTDAPPSAHRRLDSANQSFVALSHALPASEAEAFHRTVSAIHETISAAAHAEAAGLPGAEIRGALGDARRLQGDSPFVSRLQTWPRGYPGDFVTIEQLVAQANSAPRGSLAFYVEEYSLASAIAQQHRNKVAAQSLFIQEAVPRTCAGSDTREPSAGCSGARGGRVLLIACGSCPDLRQIQSALHPCDFEVVLNDADPDALDFSLERLGLIADRVRAVPGNVFSAIRHLVREGPFDAVLAGGLYDYLDDRAARKLTGYVVDRLLSDEGRFFFTNVTRGNPYRPWMEHLADWSLIERSEADVRELVAGSTDAPLRVDVSRDSTGLAHLVHVAKGAGPRHPRNRPAPVS